MEDAEVAEGGGAGGSGSKLRARQVARLPRAQNLRSSSASRQECEAGKAELAVGHAASVGTENKRKKKRRRKVGGNWLRFLKGPFELPSSVVV